MRTASRRQAGRQAGGKAKKRRVAATTMAGGSAVAVPVAAPVVPVPLVPAQRRAACPAWRAAWAMALAPELGTRGLEALRDALAADSDELLQQATTDPPDLRLVGEGEAVLADPATEPVRGADPLAYALWRGLAWPQGATVAALTALWASLVRSAAARLEASGLAGVELADFYRFWDGSGRRDAVRGLLEAVEAELASRQAGAALQAFPAARPALAAEPSPWAADVAGILSWRMSLSRAVPAPPAQAAPAPPAQPPRPPRPQAPTPAPVPPRPALPGSRRPSSRRTA